MTLGKAKQHERDWQDARVPQEVQNTTSGRGLRPRRQRSKSGSSANLYLKSVEKTLHKGLVLHTLSDPRASEANSAPKFVHRHTWTDRQTKYINE